MNFFDINPKLYDFANQSEKNCKEIFEKIDETCEYNSNKVLKAFIDNRISENHLKGTTGYGYGDIGRDCLDKVFAQAVGAEDALVRHSFVSGTHALAVALFGILRTGNTMTSITGKPYDTLEEVIGIRGNGNGSLKDFGINYKQIDLTDSGEPDYDAIAQNIKGSKIAYIQRSRGYSLRPSLSVDKIAQMTKLVKSIDPDIIVVVDNCYGEFVEKTEPLSVGADLIVGSLIKNPGGAIAETGGYIAGKEKLVELCSYRLTSPGMGKEVGCSLNTNKSMYMGLFMAPSVVANALKTSVFAAKFFTDLGFEAFPKYNEERTDIISAIKLGSPEALTAFCVGIQKGSPIDSFVAPEAWDMPGYDSKVIMAAGAFTMGASIELSADAPLKEPFAVWMQGGITYHSGKMGIILAAQSLINKGLLNFA